MHTNPYLVIAGSTRPLRRSPAVAQWVADLGNQFDDGAFRVIDLKDLELGLDDEPGIPAKGGYVRATTRRWSELVQGAAGVVFVTPQYNWGYPAPLKNAIDHLHAEWRDKPVLIVTYGARGGGKCAAQLRQVLAGLDVKLTAAKPGLRLGRDSIEADDGRVDPAQDFAGHRGKVERGLRQLMSLSRRRRAA